MLDWQIILLTILVVAAIGWLWFVTIKDIMQRVSNSKSKKVANGADNDNSNDKPKPKGMSNVKSLNCVINSKDKPYTKSQTDSNINPHQSKSITLNHLIGIIKRMRLW